MRHLGVCLMITFGALNVSSQPVTPPVSVQEVLKQLPNRQLHPDIVLFFGVKNSDSFRQTQLSQLTKDVPYFRAAQALDAVLSAQVQARDDRTEVNSPFNPEQKLINTYGFGISKRFSTGTSMELRYQSLSTELTYSPAILATPGFGASLPTDPYFENTVSLTLSQDLWRDAFGHATRKSLQAGEIGRGAVEEQVAEAVGQWSLELMKVYYNAWLGQQMVDAADENRQRQQRLLKIVRLQHQRGTVENPDLLQVRGSVLQAENEVASTRQNLRDIWRSLVISLGFPREWITVDPRLIPMSMDSPVEEVAKACGTPAKLADPPEVSSRLSRLKAEVDRTRLLYEVAESQMAPTVQLQLSAAANGIDEQLSDSAQEAMQYTHPNTAVGLMLTVPWSRSSQKATLAESFAAKTRAELLWRQERDQVEIEWINGCRALFELQQQQSRLDKLMKLQKDRVQQEERLFRLGRRQAFDVIQAGRELTATVVTSGRIAVDMHVQAWTIRNLLDRIPEYLRSLPVLSMSENMGGK